MPKPTKKKGGLPQESPAIPSGSGMGPIPPPQPPGNIPVDSLEQRRLWHTIYPQYINANLTVERGRRIAKSKCVPEPLAEEIFNVMAAHGQYFEVQLNMNKFFCRELDKENIRYRGYIKYRVLPEGEKQFKNKRQILFWISSLIPKLKSRQNPQQQQQQQKQTGGNENVTGGEKPSAKAQHTGGNKKKNRRK